MSSHSTVLYETNAHGIALVTLNRPAVHNAIDPDVLERLSAVLVGIAADDGVRAVVLTGAGDMVFSAGADIRYLNQASPLAVRELAMQAVRVTGQLENLGKPTVAALNGHTFGGGLEIAEACMLRVVVEGAQLGHPEVHIGAVAGFGGTTRLARLVGKGRAAEMLLTGRAIDAEEALRIGLVTAVVPRASLMSHVTALLDSVLVQYPTAVRLSWEALHRGLNMSLEESAALGADYFGLAATTVEFRQGTRRFLDRRLQREATT
ncbi:MAG: enoyl-CoA hydratase-related protein [Zoogloeaceae bacterium]|nr:enoyl-CoA hydratase-related protein [Zoogloeaceae bacterium]